jgi:predicted permease
MVRWSYGYRYLLAPPSLASDLEAENSFREFTFRHSSNADEITPLQHDVTPASYYSRSTSFSDHSSKEDGSSLGTSPVYPNSPMLGEDLLRVAEYDRIPSFWISQERSGQPSQQIWWFLSVAWREFLDFMNPPLWAMLAAFIIALVPRLQYYLFFEENGFLRGSVIYGIRACGNVSIPLVLVILGANIANDKISPEENHQLNSTVTTRSPLTEQQKSIILAVAIRMFIVPVR